MTNQVRRLQLQFIHEVVIEQGEVNDVVDVVDTIRPTEARMGRYVDGEAFGDQIQLSSRADTAGAVEEEQRFARTAFQ